MQYTTDATQAINVSGTPEGNEAANVGSIAYDRTNGNVYIKKTGTGNTGWEQIPSGGDVGQTITGDTGGAISPTAGNWNILGQQAGTIPVMDTIGSGSTLNIENRTWTTKLVVDSSSTVGLRGTYSTLSSAMAAAVSGDTIFLRTSVTENVTLTPGVNIVSFLGAELTPTVTITGKLTMTGAGTCTIAGIQLITNSDFFLSVTGTLASILNLENCYLNCLNSTGINYSSSSSSSKIKITNCKGNIGTTGISLFTSTGSGSIQNEYTEITNTGSSTTASTTSVSPCSFNYCTYNLPLSSSGTGTFSFIYTVISNTSNTSCVTTAGTGTTNIAYYSRFESGTASAISIGVNTSISMVSCSFISSNTNAITGAGSLSYTDLKFFGSSSLINTTTQSALYTTLGKSKSPFQPKFLAALSANALNVTGNGTSYTVICNTEIFDVGDNYNNATGTLTSPETGKWVLSWTGQLTGCTINTRNTVKIVTSNNTFQNFFERVAAATSISCSHTVVADMDAGDTATFTIIGAGEAADTDDVVGSGTTQGTNCGGWFLG